MVKFLNKLLPNSSTFRILQRQNKKTYIQQEPSLEDEIVIAMSSGVDSSVCASLYASKYPNVRGIYMANWTQTKDCVERDWNDVKKVASTIGIPCERVNFEREYWMDVFEPMIDQYKKGLTPNPDVGCNKYVKFGKMIEHLTKMFKNSNKKWWLVTGHYARIMMDAKSKEYHLLRGIYEPKDQSYYLSTVPSSLLHNILLPLGHKTKPEVRHLAKKTFNLPVAEKPDSQGLCFVSQKGSFREFLNEFIPANPGDIVTEDGTVVGKHQGIWHATIGQKSGVCMPQGDPKTKGVWFVSEKRRKENQIVIVNGGKNKSLYSNWVKIENWSWLGDGLNTENVLEEFNKVTAQHRSLQEEVLVDKVVKDDEGNILVKFKDLSRAVAPGQSLVLYGDHDRLLGSGVIIKSWKEL